MSQIVSLIRLEDTSRCFTLKSTPIVDCMCSSNESSVNRSSIEDCGLYCIALHWIALDVYCSIDSMGIGIVSLMIDSNNPNERMKQQEQK